MMTDAFDDDQLIHDALCDCKNVGDGEKGTKAHAEESAAPSPTPPEDEGRDLPALHELMQKPSPFAPPEDVIREDRWLWLTPDRDEWNDVPPSPQQVADLLTELEQVKKQRDALWNLGGKHATT
jgi:hypothetical protein